MVYLIHFEEKLKHAQHYIGYVEKDLDQRIKRHRSNKGAKLLKAVNQAGIKWDIVKTWEDGDQTFERKLKNRGGAKRICPTCQQNKKNGL